LSLLALDFVLGILKRLPSRLPSRPSFSAGEERRVKSVFGTKKSEKVLGEKGFSPFSSEFPTITDG
jgi:hypothetical protein